MADTSTPARARRRTNRTRAVAIAAGGALVVGGLGYSVAGDVALRAAVPADGVTVTDADDALWGALHVRVATTTSTTAACDATAGASTQRYCFEVSPPASPTLPASVPLDALQGRTAAPAWQFAAESD